MTMRASGVENSTRGSVLPVASAASTSQSCTLDPSRSGFVGGHGTKLRMSLAGRDRGCRRSSPRRRLRTAWPMRCSFSISAKRTKPSPPGPKPLPGETATSQSRISAEANSSEPRSA